MRLIRGLSKKLPKISNNETDPSSENESGAAWGSQGVTHVPVLIREVLEFLRPQECSVFMDGTVGMGGHGSAILRLMRSDSIFIGIDKDKESLAVAEERLREFKERMYLFHGDFKNFDAFFKKSSVSKVDAVLLDLGVSSFQLEQSFRGFSFSKNAPLDMRMDRTSLISASDLVNNLSEQELGHILYTFGEERWSKRIARRIVEERKTNPILSTQQLSEIIIKAMPFVSHRIHPATRCFQALRIAVNRELESLEEFLYKISPYCGSGTRIAVISFHSLEDRIVKHAFKRLALERRLKIITKKPVLPQEDELIGNKRSRSAKLRVAEWQ